MEQKDQENIVELAQAVYNVALVRLRFEYQDLEEFRTQPARVLFDIVRYAYEDARIIGLGDVPMYVLFNDATNFLFVSIVNSMAINMPAGLSWNEVFVDFDGALPADFNPGIAQIMNLFITDPVYVNFRNALSEVVKAGIVWQFYGGEGFEPMTILYDIRNQLSDTEIIVGEGKSREGRSIEDRTKSSERYTWAKESLYMGLTRILQTVQREGDIELLYTEKYVDERRSITACCFQVAIAVRAFNENGEAFDRSIWDIWNQLILAINEVFKDNDELTKQRALDMFLKLEMFQNVSNLYERAIPYNFEDLVRKRFELPRVEISLARRAVNFLRERLRIRRGV